MGVARSVWRADAPLLLASASQARQALLEAAGVPVETVSSGVDERLLEASLGDVAPVDLAGHLARAKTLAVATRHPDRIVIGADQVCELEGRPLSKAASREEARGQLSALSGRMHQLHAAAAIAIGGELVDETRDSAALTMRVLDETTIERYLNLVDDAVLDQRGRVPDRAARHSPDGPDRG
jgi:septum formation protein